MPGIELPERIRAFVAIRLPDELLVSLRELQARLQAGLPEGVVRWSPPEQTHLTLKFLGDIATADLRALTEGLRGICLRTAPLLLRAEGIGCFPNPGRPKVVWVGVAGDLAELERLQSQIEAVMKPWCERSEDRPFRPHLTIGRVREARPHLARQVGAKTAEMRVAQLAEWKVTQIDLVSSRLSPKGAEHTIVASLPLTQ